MSSGVWQDEEGNYWYGTEEWDALLAQKNQLKHQVEADAKVIEAAECMESWDHPGHPGKADQAKRKLYKALNERRAALAERGLQEKPRIPWQNSDGSWEER